MKKILAGLVLATVFAGMAQAVTSENAVGFINRTELKAGQLYAFCIPFDDMANTEGSDYWVLEKSPFAEQAPGGSTIYFWNVAGQAWRSATKNAATGKWRWPSKLPGETEFRVNVGELVFFKPGADMDSFIVSGEVPDDVIPVALSTEGLTAIGLPYPVEKTFLDTDLSKKAPDGAMVYFWDTAAGWQSAKYNGVTKKWRFPTGNNRTIAPGEGFFYKSPKAAGALTEWREAVPYAWPNKNGSAE